MGPILGATLGLVSTNPSQGIGYMIAYILGFSIPFLILALFTGRFNLIKRYSEKLMKVGGTIMIAFGIVLFFDQMTLFNRLLEPIFGGFQGF